MDRMRKAGLLTWLIEELHNNGSWCGETQSGPSMSDPARRDQQEARLTLGMWRCRIGLRQ